MSHQYYFSSGTSAMRCAGSEFSPGLAHAQVTIAHPGAWTQKSKWCPSGTGRGLGHEMHTNSTPTCHSASAYNQIFKNRWDSQFCGWIYFLRSRWFPFPLDCWWSSDRHRGIWCSTALLSRQLPSVHEFPCIPLSLAPSFPISQDRALFNSPWSILLHPF